MDRYCKLFIHIMLWVSVTSLPFASAEESPSIADLGIPENLGKIEQRVQGNTEHWVIHIQDVHAHFMAQDNVAAIVDHLNHAYGIDTVGLEGAWSERIFKESWGLPSSREKQFLARELLEQDLITGPAYAALFSKTPLTFIGIENQELYEKNRLLYVEHLENRFDTVKKINQWRNRIADDKQYDFNPDLRKFDAQLSEFRNGKKAEKFIPELIEMSKAKNIDLSDLSQVVLFEKIMIQESQIQKSKLELESARIMKQFKKTRLNFEELLRSGKIGAEKLDFYPATVQYKALLELQDQLDHHIFFDQIDEAVGRLKESLFITDAERALDQASDRQHLAEKVLILRATPKDLARYHENMDFFSEDIRNYDLSDALNLALNFYQAAKERDQVFFEKIKTDARLQKNIVVVAGGFHTDALSRALKDAGISYIVITPDLTEGEMNEELYFQRIQQTPTPVESETIQTPLEITFMSPLFDKAFMEGLRVLKETRNLSKAVEAVLAFQGAPEQGGGIYGEEGAVFETETFKALSDEEQRQQVRQWLAAADQSKLPIVIVIKTSELAAILQTPVGLAYWENVVAPDRMTTIAEIQNTGEYLNALIGIRAQIKRLVAQTTFQDALKKFSAAVKSKSIAVIDPDFESKRIPVLPTHPMSLFLARIVLESGLGIQDIDEDFLDRLQDLLQEIFIVDGLLKAAA